MSENEQPSNKTRELKQLKASFPHAKTATKEEILAFGVKFLRDYKARLMQELDGFKTAAELHTTLQGLAESPKNLRLGIELRQGLVDTLDRLADEVSGCMNAGKGEDDGSNNPASNSGSAKN